MRNWSSWSTRERWVVGVIVLVAAAVALSQLNGDGGSIGSALVYIGFMLGMVGLILAAAAVFRSSGQRQVDSGLSTAQKVMLTAGVIVLAWAAVSTARMDGGFVLAAFVASAAIGLAYVTVVAFGALAVQRVVRNR